MEYTSVTPVQRNSRAKALGLAALALVGTLVASYAVFNNLPSQTELVKLDFETDTTELTDLYKKWKTEYGHNFDPQEDAKRFEIFRNKDKKIREHNAGNHSYTMGHNGFSHLTEEEFAATYFGVGSQHKQDSANTGDTAHRILASPPDSVDWRTKNAVTPVKNQGACGSCWAFTATGALESYAYIKTKKLPTLSEQQLVDCAGGSYGNHGCNGGWMSGAWSYVAQNKGIASGSAYPYKGVVSKCAASGKANALGFTITGTKYVTAQNSAALISAIAVQPVAVAMDASTLQNYKSGIIGTSDKCTKTVNHGVLAVGYNKSKATGAPNGYYIIKNSWSDKWGEKGYFTIAITGNDAGVCGIQQYGMYPY